LQYNGNSLELGCIREANQSILARHPKEALWLVIGGKDKRKGSEHHKGPIDKEAASRG